MKGDVTTFLTEKDADFTAIARIAVVKLSVGKQF